MKLHDLINYKEILFVKSCEKLGAPNNIKNFFPYNQRSLARHNETTMQKVIPKTSINMTQTQLSTRGPRAWNQSKLPLHEMNYKQVRAALKKKLLDQY